MTSRPKRVNLAMANASKRIQGLLGILIFLLPIPLSIAQTVDSGIALDVSGSMKHYGPWQSKVIEVCSAILNDGRIPGGDDWAVTGDIQVVSEFKMPPGRGVLFIPFGSVKPEQAYPYFPGMRVLGSSSELESVLPTGPEGYSDGKTNKPLAISVAVSEIAKHSSVAHLIVISDFLVDADLSHSQQDFENDVESRSSVETPLILAWKQNPRVQVKLMRFKLSQINGASGTADAVKVQLLPFSLREGNPRVAEFRWKVNGPPKAGTFEIVISDRASGRTVFSKGSLVAKEAHFPDPPSGDLRWRVAARFADGTEARSAAQDINIAPSASWLLIPVVILVSLLITVAGWWIKKSEGLPDWLLFWKRKPTDWS